MGHFSKILSLSILTSILVILVAAENETTSDGSEAKVFEKHENPDVALLQEYLQIDTSHPHPDYESAVSWLETQAKLLELEFHRYDVPLDTNETTPVAIMTWPGSDPALETLMLYNHMDVVPVDRKTWTVDPFGGEVIENKIYGRGVQDMKSTSVEQILAFRNLKSKNFKPLRTIHFGFFPDEELGGHAGIKLFLATPEFEALKLGFVLDEGMYNEKGVLQVSYAERKVLWVKFTMSGTSGHGSLLTNNTAGEKLQKVINRMLNLRSHEAQRLAMGKSTTLGDVTSINLNMIGGGIQENVTPPQLWAIFDIRVTPSWNLAEFSKFLNETCELAGSDVTYELKNSDFSTETSTELTLNTWWGKAFHETCQEINLPYETRVFPAATDGRHLRKIGIPVLGISTAFNTPSLMHAPDEYLQIHDFTQGTNIYTALIEGLASAQGPQPDPVVEPKEQKNVDLEQKGTSHQKVDSGPKPSQSETTLYPVDSKRKKVKSHSGSGQITPITLNLTIILSLCIFTAFTIFPI